MKSLIFILFIFSFISQAAEVEVQWNCPQENYPGVPQLEQTQKVRVRLEDGVAKFKPDPFKPAILGDSFFRNINPLNKTKKALAVDYSECIKNFVSDLSKKIPDYGPEWTAKIQRDIEAKPFFASSKDKKFLPRKWNYTKIYNLDYSGWKEKVDEYCEGKESTYLGTEMLNYIGRNAAVVNSHPSQKCMDKIAKSIQESVEKDEAEYCELSEKICQNLKNLKKTVLTSIEENKGKRDKAMKEAEAKFGSIILQDKEAGFEEAFNGLMSKSPSDCAQYTGMIANSKDGSVGDIYKMHNLISKNMDALMNHMDGSCQKEFIRKYLDFNNANSLVGDWGIISYCKINETDFCASIRGKFKIVEDNIERMLEKAFGESGKEFFNNVACEIEAGPQSLDELLGQLKQFDKALACRDLKVGEAQVVQSNYSNMSPTGISMNYSLEKTADNRYKARFNLNFKPKSGTTVSADEMFNRAQTCMKDLSPYFRGPNGEVMEIDIINSDDAAKLNSNQRPPKLDIGINGPNHRSNSGDYNQNIDCPTIAHEVLHLTGLCDEYNEWSTGGYYDPATGQVVDKSAEGAEFIANYNCRVKAQIPSIMSGQDSVIDAVVPRAPVCECQTDECKKITNGSKKMKELYVKDPWGVANAADSYKFCDYKEAGTMTTASYEESGELVTLNSESEIGIDFTIRYLESEKLNRIQNLKYKCSCTGENDTDACRNHVANIKGKIANQDIPQKQFCPSGAKTIKRKIGQIADGKNGIFHNEDGTFSFNSGDKKSEKASLLHPQHFERIIGGTCPDKAKPYSSCAQFAYRTDPSKKCADVPKECQDSKYFLGTEGSKQ